MFEADCLSGLRKILLSGKTLTNVSGSSWVTAFVLLGSSFSSRGFMEASGAGAFSLGYFVFRLQKDNIDSLSSCL